MPFPDTEIAKKKHLVIEKGRIASRASPLASARQIER
jgi:hypothetical protein